MNNSNQLGKMLIGFAEEVASNRKVDYLDVITAIEEALAVSVRRNTNTNENERLYRVKLNPKTGETNVYRIWKVVEEVQFPTKEITLQAALLENPNLVIGSLIEDLEEGLEIKLDRIGLATFKQMVQTKIKEFEKRKIINSYIPAIGKIIKGTVRKSTRHSISVTITEYGVDTISNNYHYGEVANETNSIEAFIDKKNMIGEEQFRTNEEIKALLVGVENDESRTPRLLLSRTDNDFVRRICEREIPEIRKGLIEIVDVKRIPGTRCKVVVTSNDPRVDVLGSCIGPNSTRHQAISHELKKERIEFIEYSDDFAQYIKNILCQQDTDQIIIDEKRQIIDIAVNKEHLGQTIGLSGNNVRLAKLLTGWIVRIFDSAEFETIKAEEDAKFANVFETNLGLDEDSAHFLVEQGFTRIEELVDDSAVEDLKEYLDEEEVLMLQDLAIKYLEEKDRAAVNYIIDSKIDDRILKLDNITNEVIVKLAKHNIKTLDNLADQATDELDFIGNKELAEQLIMQARQICWFNDQEENVD